MGKNVKKREMRKRIAMEEFPILKKEFEDLRNVIANLTKENEKLAEELNVQKELSSSLEKEIEKLNKKTKPTTPKRKNTTKKKTDACKNEKSK